MHFPLVFRIDGWRPRKKQGSDLTPVFIGDFARAAFGRACRQQHKKAGRGFSAKNPRGQANGSSCGTGVGAQDPIANDQSRGGGRAVADWRVIR